MGNADGLRRVQAHLRLANVATIDRTIGSPYATIASSLDWWAQWPPSDDVMPGAHAGWVDRFGAEEVHNTLELIVAALESGRRLSYGSDARAPQ